MELVKGMPITRYCDEANLSPRERLELFAPVCHAVQHAHQKGIIHRDLKPSNVLIALYDGQPVPKVIDFGIAKATGEPLTERTVFTEVGAIVGTLEYMAPEQAELENLDIDTRADVYSLGVLLYELLTGAPPFSGAELRKAGFTEMLRIIREVEPPRPSTRLATSLQPAIAARRKSEPKKLARLVRGELDWIVMKALEKDRRRRYETASSLAQDVQRYLRNEPVEAGPPSAVYKLRKFARKHRWALLGAAFCLAVLMVTGVVAADFVRYLWGLQNQLPGAVTPAGETVPAVWKPVALAFHPHSTRLASGGPDGTVQLRDTATGEVVLVLRGHQRAVTSVAFSPKGDRIASASKDGTVRLWDSDTGEEMATLKGHSAPVSAVAFSPDGRRLASASEDRTVRIRNLPSGEPLRTFSEHEGKIHALAFSADGRHLASGNKKAHQVAMVGVGLVWSAADGEVQWKFQHRGAVWGVAFSPDGKMLASAAADQTVQLWAADTGRPMREMQADSAVYQVAFSPDSRLLATANEDGTVKVYDAVTGRTAFLLRGHAEAVGNVSFSADGRYLASAGVDGSLRLWNVATGQEVPGWRSR
jgi:WD40 repeat protein